MKTMRTERGQSIAEYAAVIALVLGAIVLMTPYVARSLQAMWAGKADQLTAGGKTQYVPYYASSTANTVGNQTETDQYNQGISTITRNSSLTRTGVNESTLDAAALANDVGAGPWVTVIAKMKRYMTNLFAMGIR